ncbi:hypothetical protein SPLC1_S030610 [Arthrospira platensis C1]|uniref:Uncharacterized protein n=1 Tax=Limnospira indica PCC 8005 TaxID=376219 RepID=A0A9P1NXY3_9CYAN|nr:hypothetical protein SPLC1_S030610 [Arthrospira platensis C1]CDM94119.1 conserved protein of unknown function [Limnospira indica PCC 8005]
MTIIFNKSKVDSQCSPLKSKDRQTGAVDEKTVPAFLVKMAVGEALS